MPFQESPWLQSSRGSHMLWTPGKVEACPEHTTGTAHTATLQAPQNSGSAGALTRPNEATVASGTECQLRKWMENIPPLNFHLGWSSGLSTQIHTSEANSRTFFRRQITFSCQHPLKSTSPAPLAKLGCKILWLAARKPQQNQHLSPAPSRPITALLPMVTPATST